jgi:type I restriction enzyme R subunit
MPAYEAIGEVWRSSGTLTRNCTPPIVNDLESEEDEAHFVQAFRKLMRAERIAILHWFWLGRFTYWWAGIWRLQSKYLDLYEKVKQDTQNKKDFHTDWLWIRTT